MKRVILNKSLLLAVFLFVSLVFCSSAFAVNWQSPINSPYADHPTYTREHWTRFYVNPNGFNKGTSGADYKGAMYSSVFDKTSTDMSQGYTAVTTLDEQKWFNSTSYNGSNGILQNFLDPYGIPQDVATQAWIVSPAYYSQSGSASPFSNQSGCVTDVAISKSNIGSYITSDFTPSNPTCITNDAPSFQAGAYDQGQPWYWQSRGSDSTGTYGEVSLTQQTAANFYTQTANSTSANVIVSFPYGLTVASLNCTQRGTNAGDPEQWQAIIYNTTPYQAMNVNLRAYVQVSGGAINLQNTTPVNINPTPVSTGGLGVYLYNFTVPKPSDTYNVYVTANLEVNSGATSVGSSTVTKEPLFANFDFGNFKKGQATPYNGHPETVAWIVPTGHSGLGAYDDNWLNSGNYSGGSTGGGSNGGNNGGGGSSQSNIAHVSPTSCNYDDINVTAQFTSTFTQAGTANAYLYTVDQLGHMQFISSVNATIKPGTNTITFPYSNQNPYGLLVAIDEKWNGSSYNTEQFRTTGGSYLGESTYNDNTVTWSNNPTERTPSPPSYITYYENDTGYYHQYTTTQVPVYKTIQVPVYHSSHIVVPYNGNIPQAKIRASLVQ